MINISGKLNFFSIFLILVGAFVLFIFLDSKNNKQHKIQEEKIKDIQVQIENLQKNNLELENKILDNEKKLVKVNDSLTYFVNKKTNLKKVYHEKIKNVDNMSIYGIDSFFTKRYK